MDRIYSVLHKPSGSFVLMGTDELCAKVGVETGYLVWAIRVDGVFENGEWTVR